MNNLERRRLNYKPKLLLEAKIKTFYVNNGIIFNDKDTIDTNVIDENLNKLTDVVKISNEYNIASIFKNGSILLTFVKNRIKEIKSKIGLNNTYKEIIDSIDENDYNKLYKYDSTFDEKNLPIEVEVYPIYKYIYNDLLGALRYIKMNLLKEFDDINDTDLMIKIVNDYLAKLIDIEYHGYYDRIDYKAISINTQIYNSLNKMFDYIQKLVVKLEHIVNKTTTDNDYRKFNNTLLNNYYNDIINIVRDNKLKIDMFKSSNIINILLDKINDQKPIIINNRYLLKTADRSTFIDILDTIKEREDSFNNIILDLYKAIDINFNTLLRYIELLNNKQDLRLSFHL